MQSSGFEEAVPVGRSPVDGEGLASGEKQFGLIYSVYRCARRLLCKWKCLNY